MKALLLILFMVASALLAPPNYVGANDAVVDPSEIEPNSTYCKEISKSGGQNSLFGPNGIVTRATQIATVIAGVISVFMMILGGFKFITSGGSPQQVASAKNTLIYSAIGIVITLAAQAIVSFIMSRI